MNASLEDPEEEMRWLFVAGADWSFRMLPRAHLAMGVRYSHVPRIQRETQLGIGSEVLRANVGLAFSLW